MWQITPYTPVTLAATLVAFASVFLLAGRLRVRGGPALVGLLLSGGWWALLYTLELSRTDLESMLGFARWQYLGIVGVPLFWLVFARQLVGRPLRMRVVAGLSLLPLVSLGLVFAFPDSRWMWRDAQVETIGSMTFLTLERGRWFYLHSAYLYGLLLAGQITIARWALRARRPFRVQALVLLAGTFLPLGANLAWVSGLVTRFDPTPLGFALGTAMIAWGVVRYGLLDLIPVARHIVVDSIEDGVLVFDRSRRLVDANAAALRFLHLEADQAIGQPAGELLAPYLESLGEIAELRESRVEQLEVAGRSFDIRLSPLYHRGQRRGEVAVFRDVSARVRQEHALREAMHEAEGANRVTSRFLATMSHELRTPLTPILGFAELLRSGATGPLTPEQEQHLDEILLSGQRLFNLITNLLEYVQLEADRTSVFEEWVDVTLLLEDLAARYAPRAEERGLAFDLSLPTEPPPLSTDGPILRQVLEQLLDNALKFTENGEVTLAATLREETCVFEVGDTGIGISPDEERRIFEAFTQASDATTTRPYGGSGLGLALCRRYCRLIGAELSLSSVPGEGSTFVVTLPLQPRGEALPALADGHRDG